MADRSAPAGAALAGVLAHEMAHTGQGADPRPPEHGRRRVAEALVDEADGLRADVHLSLPGDDVHGLGAGSAKSRVDRGIGGILVGKHLQLVTVVTPDPGAEPASKASSAVDEHQVAISWKGHHADLYPPAASAAAMTRLGSRISVNART